MHENATSSNMITNESLVETEIVTNCAADIPGKMYKQKIGERYRRYISGCVNKDTFLLDDI